MSEEKETTEERAASEETKGNFLQRIFVRRGVFQAALVPILAVFTAFILGAVVIAVSSPDVLTAWKTASVSEALRTTWALVRDAYVALFEGSFGSPAGIV